jgi:hypothetical protein
MTRLKKIKRNNLPRLKDQYITLRELHTSRKNPTLLKPGTKLLDLQNTRKILKRCVRDKELR